MKKQIKKIISGVYYGLLMNHNTHIEPDPMPHYNYSPTDVKLIAVSHNNIIETPAGYFRLVRRNYSKKLFDEETANIYCSVNQLKTIELCNKWGYERFKQHEDDLRNHSSRLFKYICFNANSSTSETLVAKYLGLEQLLTKTEFCVLNLEGKISLFGTMSTKAPGVPYDKVKDNLAQRMTPELLRALTNLNLLDVISYERDHGANNYMNIVDEEGKIRSICAFDNDYPESFKISSSVSFTFSGDVSPFISSDGYVQRPYLDKMVVERLAGLDMKLFKKELSKYLNRIQLYFLTCRIQKIREAIKKSKDKGYVRLLEPDEWTQQMVEEEVKGGNGRTYMYVLVDWYDHFNKK